MSDRGARCFKSEAVPFGINLKLEPSSKLKKLKNKNYTCIIVLLSNLTFDRKPLFPIMYDSVCGKILCTEGWLSSSLHLHLSLLILSLHCTSLSEWWRTKKVGRSTWCFLPVRTSVRPAVRREGRSHWREMDAGLTISSTVTRACSRTGNW